MTTSTNAPCSCTSTVDQNLVGTGATAINTAINDFTSKSVSDIANGVNALSSMWFWLAAGIAVLVFMRDG